MTAAETSYVRTRVDGFAASTLVGLCIIWGLSQVAIKVANAGLQPVFQGGLRSLLGTILIVLWCRYRGVSLTARDGTLISGTIAGLLFGLEFILLYVALDYTSVSRAIVFLYVAPFVVAVGAHFLIPGERLTPVRIAGFLAAFAGILLCFSDRLSLPSPEAWIGDLLCLIAAIAWGVTTLVIKISTLNRARPEKVLAYQLAVSAVMMLALAPLFGPFIREFDGLVAAAFLYQVLVVVAASYLMWFWLLAHYPASQLSAFSFLSPLFAVMFGALLLSEPVSTWLILALALVGFGIFLVNRPSRG